MCVDKVLNNVHLYHSVLLVGDFNVNAPHFQPASKVYTEGDARLYKNLIETLDTRNMSQLVTFVTRRYSDNDLDGTLIDHLYTNNLSTVQSVNPHCGITGSDHAGISFRLNLTAQKQLHPPGTFLLYSKADMNGLHRELDSINWHELFHGKNTNDAWHVFKEKYLECIHKFVPSRKSRKQFKKPWITD